jgi:hypothetical protein
MELREHALEYDAEKVMADYWTPALKAIEERFFSERKPSVSRTKLAA